MMSDLEKLVDTIQREKNIPRDVVIEILESAMEAAARKRYGMLKDIEAQAIASRVDLEIARTELDILARE